MKGQKILDRHRCLYAYSFAFKCVISGRYEKNLLEAVAGILNFTYLISNPPDGKWGEVTDDGWIGLVRYAQDGIVDFVICDVFLTYGRAQVSNVVSLFVF